MKYTTAHNLCAACASLFEIVTSADVAGTTPKRPSELQMLTSLFSSAYVTRGELQGMNVGAAIVATVHQSVKPSLPQLHDMSVDQRQVEQPLVYPLLSPIQSIAVRKRIVRSRSLVADKESTRKTVFVELCTTYVLQFR